MIENSRDSLALALDNVSELKSVLSLVESTAENVGIYKIGLEQYIRFGPSILEHFRKLKSQVFLDLKLHDIPNTVAQAVLAANELNVDFLTIHSFGGVDMMRAAAKALAQKGSGLKLLAVTVLTSISQSSLNDELAVPGSIVTQVERLARLAVKSGVNGIVCSAADLEVVRPSVPEDCLVVTPGIRRSADRIGDQKRICTPRDAIARGASLLVVGRPITEAPSPADAALEIRKEIEEGLTERKRSV